MINKAILVGRLVRDPELKITQSQLSVVSFTVACDRPYQSNGEYQADFINCVAWRQTAEFICRYFKKGNAIGIDGSIQTRQYQDQNGSNRISTEVIVERASFVDSKSASSSKNTKNNNVSKQSSDNQSINSKNTNYSSGSIDDFEELESDKDLPF